MKSWTFAVTLQNGFKVLGLGFRFRVEGLGFGMVAAKSDKS